MCTFGSQIIVTYIGDISRVIPLGDILPLKNRDIFDILNISRYIQYVAIYREILKNIAQLKKFARNLKKKFMD